MALFRLKLTGLCALVPDSPFDGAADPTKLTVCLLNLLVPTPLTRTNPQTGRPEILDAHYPFLDYPTAQRPSPVGDLPSSFSHQQTALSTAHLLTGHDVSVEVDGQPVAGAVTRTGLSKVVALDRISPGQGTIAPRFLTDPLVPAFEVIARLHLADGNLSSFEISSDAVAIESQGVPTSQPLGQIATSLAWEIPFTSQVKLRFAHPKIGEHFLTFGLPPQPNLNDVIEATVHNEEIDRFLGVSDDYFFNRALADVEVYYKLSLHPPAAAAVGHSLPALISQGPAGPGGNAGLVQGGKCPSIEMAVGGP